MKIGIDIRCLTDGKRTGVEEYTINLLQNLFDMDHENQYLLFLNSYREPGFDVRQFAEYKNVTFKQFRYPNKLLNLCFWYLKWPHVDKMLGGTDIFFMPNINFIALSKKTKLVLTVHDLSYELFPETFSLKSRLWHNLINPRSLCKRADKIIAVSESTKQDIMGRWGIGEFKIQKIHNGANEEIVELDRNDPKLIDVKDRYHLPFNFILYLGTIEPRKNVESLIRAYDHMRSLRHPQLDKFKLVLAGRKGWQAEKILDVARKARFTNDIIFTSCVTNEDKAAVLTLASLFIYPSHFEGFGIPVLEALRCTLPVVSSNMSALPEVLGDAGLLVDPDKPDELYLAMKEILLDRELQQHFKEKAWRQAMKFSWRTAARETYQVFEKLEK
ncbi:MAG TPA: glycosyltransferase family 1 protein [Patescibacteria group bacterium]